MKLERDVEREVQKVAALIVDAARIEAASAGVCVGHARATFEEVLGTLPGHMREAFAVEVAQLLAAALAAVPDRGAADCERPRRGMPDRSERAQVGSGQPLPRKRW